MSDMNINLNIPLPWDSMEQQIIKDSTSRLTKAMVSEFGSLNDYVIRNILTGERSYGSGFQKSCLRVAEIVINDYVEKHAEKILDAAISSAIDKVLKRKVFKDKVSEISFSEEVL